MSKKIIKTALQDKQEPKPDYALRRSIFPMCRTVELFYDASKYMYKYSGLNGMAALHVYTLIPDLNWDNSYMVSRVMDSFTAAHHVREFANTVAVSSRLWENFENTPNFHES